MVLLHLSPFLLLLLSIQTDLESLDPRGRTPLHLAVTLGHLDCARVLLQHGADVSKENRNGWTGEKTMEFICGTVGCILDGCEEVGKTGWRLCGGAGDDHLKKSQSFAKRVLKNGGDVKY